MRRRYEMRARAESAERTRAAIIAGAHRLLNRRDGTALTLQEVAVASGVSRATIYKSIGSRTELLRAVFEDQGRLIKFERVLAAIQIDDPRAAVIATIRESCRAWSVFPHAIRKTLALAAIDPEIAELVNRYERSRRARLAQLAGRLPGAGRSRARIESFAETLALLTSYATYDHLGLNHDARWVADFLVQTAVSCLDLGDDL